MKVVFLGELPKNGKTLHIFHAAREVFINLSRCANAIELT